MIALELIVLTLACLANAVFAAFVIVGGRVLSQRIEDLECQPPGASREAHVDLEERVAKLESPPPKPKRVRRSTSKGLGETETPVV